MGMGRKRKHGKDLPLRMRFKHGAYYLRLDKEIHLGRNYHKALLKYAEIVDPNFIENVSALMDRYFKYEVPAKAPRTQRNNTQEVKPLRAYFGRMRPEDVTPQDIYRYLDNRPKVAGNREKALLSSIFSKAIHWGIVSQNPCRWVKRNKEKPRDRYIEHWEYRAVRNLGTDSMKLAMDIAYQTGLRMGDILRLTLKNVSEEGISVTTGKDKKRIIFQWTPELKSIVEAAKGRKITGIALVCTRQGHRYTEWGFQAIWQRLMRKAIEEKVIEQRFQFRDLRGKAGSDADNAQELLAHNSSETTNRHYRRSPRKVTPIRPIWDT